MMKKEHRVELIIALISLGLGIIFELVVSYSDKNSSILTNIKDGLFLSLLLSIFLMSLYRLPIIKHIESSLGKNKEKINKITDTIQVLATNQKNSDVVNHINKLSDDTKKFGTIVFRNYLDKFKLTQGGFEVEGEQFALQSYAAFWRLLSDKQRELNSKKEKCMVARITHSNDISIWEPQSGHQVYSTDKNSLYHAQRDFIKHGGIIVRILVGEDIKPNERYIAVMSAMEKIGIKVFYLDKATFCPERYDFLFLYDENIILKWIAPFGNHLSSFIFQDGVEDADKEIWKNGWYHLEDKGEQISSSIPQDRQFDLTPNLRV